MINLSFLNAQRGHGEIVINEDDPAERKKLAESLIPLLRQGFQIFLMTGNEVDLGKKIVGYNDTTNEWLLKKGRGNQKKSAKDTKALAMAPMAGGL